MIAAENATDHVPSELFAMTAEHSSLQAARSSTIFETGVRATLFLGAVSSGLLALAFLGQLSAQSSAFHLIALVILPALVVLGLLTHLRLVELAVEDVFYGRAINRIRHYYCDLAPQSQHYFLLTGSDDLAGVAANTGRPRSRWHFLSHAATTTLIVTSILAGTADALALYLAAGPALLVTAGLGVVTAIALATAMLVQQSRSWARADGQTTSIFPSASHHPIDDGRSNRRVEAGAVTLEPLSTGRHHWHRGRAGSKWAAKGLDKATHSSEGGPARPKTLVMGATADHSSSM